MSQVGSPWAAIQSGSGATGWTKLDHQAVGPGDLHPALSPGLGHDLLEQRDPRGNQAVVLGVDVGHDQRQHFSRVG